MDHVRLGQNSSPKQTVLAFSMRQQHLLSVILDKQSFKPSNGLHPSCTKQQSSMLGVSPRVTQTSYISSFPETANKSINLLLSTLGRNSWKSGVGAVKACLQWASVTRSSGAVCLLYSSGDMNVCEKLESQHQSLAICHPTRSNCVCGHPRVT